MLRVYATCLMTVLCIFLSSVPLIADEDSKEMVGGWMDEDGVQYEETEYGGFVLGFESTVLERVDVYIDFSEIFIHVSIPIGFIPEDPGGDYFRRIIEVTGNAPMIKPIFDEDEFFYISIDFPLDLLTSDELMSDIVLLVEFIEANHSELIPDEMEEGN